MRLILCFLFLSVSHFNHAQENTPVIDVCGKSYEITGSFLTIIIAENLLYGKPETLAPEIVEQIKNRYREKMNTLNRRYANAEMTLEVLEDSLAQLNIQLEVAQRQVQLLTEEFSTIDLQTTSYLYQLAYFFFRNGQLAEASAVLSDDALAKIELIQARKYIQKARATEQLGDSLQARQILKKAVSRYPVFEVRMAYGKRLLASDMPERAAIHLQAAVDLAGSVGQQSTGYCFLAQAYEQQGAIPAAQNAAREIIVIRDKTGYAVSGEIDIAQKILSRQEITVVERARQLLRAEDFEGFNNIVQSENVKDYNIPFSKEAYQLKMLYLHYLELRFPNKVKKEKRKITRFYKTK